ncbi:MAG: OmpA family protein [Prevotella sp.]|nr:OmpA family protein [Prevotella sp.]
MKKLLIVLAFAGVTTAVSAQSKNSVATNSFLDNWFVQVGAQWNAFYSGEEHGANLKMQPWKSFRSNPQVGIAIGKWFAPEIGLRVKADGMWGKATFLNNNGKNKSFRYVNLQFQPVVSLSNIICGYNAKRFYNLNVFAGGGFARNFTTNGYAMGLSAGIMNQFRITDNVGVNLEFGWNRMENDFDGVTFAPGPDEAGGGRGWDSHDNYVYAELGLTVNLGKATWGKGPDVDALNAAHQAALDALNAKLRDAKAENDRLQKLLKEALNRPVEKVPESVKEFITTPVSVFFNLAKVDVANPKDLVNVRALAKYAKENNSNILVTGYADNSTGSPAINEKLSINRAETVKGELVKMGVSSSKIKTDHKGGVKILGEDLPIDFDRRATVQITE